MLVCDEPAQLMRARNEVAQPMRVRCVAARRRVCSSGGMGYDSAFLDLPLALPLPDAAEPDASGPDAALPDPAKTTALDYTHFTVLLDRKRRLARVSGVNLDGSDITDLPRADDWRYDPRIPPEWQTGPAVYAGNDLDRGHLVRRRDPVWGADAAQAESDTFHYTNAAPQAAGFNQSKELWLGLEDHVLAYASANSLRLSVFTAPILDASDPAYRGIRVPLRFWKVAAWVDGDSLAAAGFVLDQSGLEGVPTEIAAGLPPLGPFRTFQTPIADISAASGVRMPQLVAADGMRGIAPIAWRELKEPSDIVV